MVNYVKNYDKKDVKNSDVVGEISFFRSHNGEHRGQSVSRRLSVVNIDRTVRVFMI